MLDEFLSNFILILRNLGVGKFIAEDGAVDEDFFTRMHGAILRLNEGKRLDSIKELPPQQIPPEIMQFATVYHQYHDKHDAQFESSLCR